MYMSFKNSRSSSWYWD